ncbi:MAG: DUF1178 family protein [Methylocapsa sp.]|nr:DUF1178 family protein [Methylocapsa sp.]
MIRFALRCTHGHEFESWFQSGEAFDAQMKSGLVACPLCQANEVRKAVMAPALAGRAAELLPSAKPQDSRAPVALLDRRDRELRAVINAFRKHVFEVAEDVGTRFAGEARKIHDGLVPGRAIYGQANLEEARALIEDGIAVLPLPPAADNYN